MTFLYMLGGVCMQLSEKLQMLRKRSEYFQERLVNTLGFARQTISKWENGRASPELNYFIRLSNLYGVTMDQMVTEDEESAVLLHEKVELDIDQLLLFLIKAKNNTFSKNVNKVHSSRMNSNDYSYCDQVFQYYDTYVGNAQFSGKEAVWLHDVPNWSMYYTGRVLRDLFDIHIFKEALLYNTIAYSYRGPAIYTKGDYHYHCHVDGIFECYFHEGVIT